MSILKTEIIGACPKCVDGKILRKTLTGTPINRGDPVYLNQLLDKCSHCKYWRFAGAELNESFVKELLKRYKEKMATLADF